ncbi:peptidase m20 domain-containing protein 2 [Plakobranchus ocellatus]|uniref:Peptidase m20 domain-containing protein 2 n=1 Tax=Plakobranchus ocellatus TaxID=259542 RepID=A0AAV4DEM3_9GAST|nr:peptidase m20 domain-containing protein 2 [Plakobranchus ocellatus]
MGKVTGLGNIAVEQNEALEDIRIDKVTITFEGKAAHASTSPWDGVNALDAAVLCYQNISCMRQQFKPTWRVHGIFTKAGEKPNIIPEKAELLYFIRAPSTQELKELTKKMIGCFEGSAIASGCKVNYTFASKSYDSLMSNERLSSLYVANGEALGIEFENDPTLLSKQGGSTDMGNVSRVLPSIHPKYSLHTQVSAHTSEFRDIAYTEQSHDLTLLHAKALAMAAVDVYQNPGLVAKMKSDFQQQLRSES